MQRQFIPGEDVPSLRNCTWRLTEPSEALFTSDTGELNYQVQFGKFHFVQ